VMAATRSPPSCPTRKPNAPRTCSSATSWPRPRIASG
jgi:hypothetical protein